MTPRTPHCHAAQALVRCRALRPFSARKERRALASSATSGGEGFPIRRRKREDWDCGPTFDLSREKAVELQLQVLKDNNKPTPDHGIEVLYRFANFDPFKRSRYFGRALDLGQFERFRRVFHTPQYATLLCHTSHELLSSLQVTELQWRQRVHVQGYKGDSGVFEFAMIQRFGGRYDGIWFTEQLVAEDCDYMALIVCPIVHVPEGCKSGDICTFAHLLDDQHVMNWNHFKLDKGIPMLYNMSQARR